MRKGSAIGLVVAVLFISVIGGIAAIPDEVLEESTSLAKSDTVEMTVPVTPLVTVPIAPEVNTLQAVVSEPATPEVTEPEPPVVSEPATPEVNEPEPPVVSEPATPEVNEPENSEPDTHDEESKGNVIRVEIRDGVGTSLK